MCDYIAVLVGKVERGQEERRAAEAGRAACRLCHSDPIAALMMSARRCRRQGWHGHPRHVCFPYSSAASLCCNSCALQAKSSFAAGTSA